MRVYTCDCLTIERDNIEEKLRSLGINIFSERTSYLNNHFTVLKIFIDTEEELLVKLAFPNGSFVDRSA